MSTLELGVIGNCSFGALIDPKAKIVWSCLPRFDADPVFCSLLNNDATAEGGFFDIVLEDCVRSEQEYVGNTAILRTRLFGEKGDAIEITDFAPRFYDRRRMYRPTMIIRRVRPLAGSPRITVCMRPRYNYGVRTPTITHGSNHIRYVQTGAALRLSTTAPLTYVLNETPFLIEQPICFIFGPDETITGGLEDTAAYFEDRTQEYWRTWTRRLHLPLEWQDAVIRSAITLKLCNFEETGAIIAAMTTSIPEAADSGRNWDYRFCWLRDAFFVVRALNSLSEVETMEHYLRYLNNLIRVARNGESHLQPVYGIGLEDKLTEREITSLSGYRGMGPVRSGNQAYEHFQHDVYGNVVLASAQAFIDRRLFRPAQLADFERLEKVGQRAYELHNQADAGMWELRTRAAVHTTSSLMCWAACDRLAKLAIQLNLTKRAQTWREKADEIKETILENAWNEKKQTFVESFGGESVDAGLLLMAEVGFIDPDDTRFVATVKAIEDGLRRDKHLFRYANADDFGVPQNAFNICTFWYIDALIRLDRKEEAREIFESMLACRNGLGLLSEDVDPSNNELWGNYPQTYSLVGIINAATRLSRSWEEEV